MRQTEKCLNGWAQRMHQHVLGAEWLESSLAKKGLGVMVDTKLNVSPWDKEG